MGYKFEVICVKGVSERPGGAIFLADCRCLQASSLLCSLSSELRSLALPPLQSAYPMFLYIPFVSPARVHVFTSSTHLHCLHICNHPLKLKPFYAF